jgi:DNA gyrase/topoisomerase IV subunit B
VDAVSKMNTGGKYDSKAFKKSVGLNGVGTKAVNALSDYFRVRSFRDGKMKAAEFSRGIITENFEEKDLQTETEPRFPLFRMGYFPAFQIQKRVYRKNAPQLCVSESRT